MKKLFFIIFCSFIVFFNFSLSGICAETDLSVREKNIVNITSYATRGDLLGLETVLNKALDDKMTIYEIKEILLQIYIYCGLPRSINALTTFMKVSDERSAKGVYDEYGTEPVDLTDDKNRLDIGTAIQTELVGVPVTGRLYEFEPAIDKFVKEHLFADIFSRGVLSYEEREIVALASLSSMESVDFQLKNHIQICLNMGIPRTKIDEILKMTKVKHEKQTEKVECESPINP